MGITAVFFDHQSFTGSYLIKIRFCFSYRLLFDFRARWHSMYGAELHENPQIFYVSKITKGKFNSVSNLARECCDVM